MAKYSILLLILAAISLVALGITMLASRSRMRAGRIM